MGGTSLKTLWAARRKGKRVRLPLPNVNCVIASAGHFGNNIEHVPSEKESRNAMHKCLTKSPMKETTSSCRCKHTAQRNKTRPATRHGTLPRARSQVKTNNPTLFFAHGKSNATIIRKSSVPSVQIKETPVRSKLAGKARSVAENKVFATQRIRNCSCKGLVGPLASFKNKANTLETEDLASKPSSMPQE